MASRYSPIAQDNIVLTAVKPALVSVFLSCWVGYFVKEPISQGLASAGGWAPRSGSLPRAASAGQCSEWATRLLDFLLWCFCYCDYYSYPRDGAAMLWLNRAARLGRRQRKSRALESGIPEMLHIHVAQLTFFFDKYRWALIAVNKNFIKIS